MGFVKAVYNKSKSDVPFVLGLILVMQYWDAIRSFIGDVPLVVWTAILVGLMGWTAFESFLDIREAPFWVFFAQPIMCMMLLYHWGAQNSVWPDFAGLEIALAVVGGLGVWFIGLITLHGIAISLLNVDIEEHRAEQRKERTSDPYGDKHAAKILDDDTPNES